MKLLNCGVSALTGMGAECEVIDLAALNLPLYAPDDEKDNFPEAAKQLKAQLTAADGLLITCPEYNGILSPLLLNSITWATRGEGGMYDAFKGKCTCVMATSPGQIGGLRMVRSLQQFLQDMGAVTIPGNVAIGGGFKAFDENDALDERNAAKVQAVCGQLMHFARFEANRDSHCSVLQELKRQQCMAEYGNLE